MTQRAIFVGAALALVLALSAAASARAHPVQLRGPFCARVVKGLPVSSGARAFCGSVASTKSASRTRLRPSFEAVVAPRLNIEAADPREDVAPSGLRAYGQSEESIAASGRYVVVGWNDATGEFAPCPSPKHKEEHLGYGFSADGGASFSDEGGLRPRNCAFRYFADPAAEAWRVRGRPYFYLAGLYDRPDGFGPSEVALDACRVTRRRRSSKLACGRPTVVSRGSCTRTSCDFLDKDYIAIDPVRGRLHLTYTDFGPSDGGTIELTNCDIGTTSGRPGPAGGTAGRPVCDPRKTALAPPSPSCSQTSSYPAVDTRRGDVYVAWEFNYSTAFNSGCNRRPIRNLVARIPARCLSFASISRCTTFKHASVRVTSFAAAPLPGYNRFPFFDDPRIAVSRPARTVSIVWNDTRSSMLGDILLQSFKLGSLSRIQRSAVRLNPHRGRSNFLPALRNADASGRLSVTWYARRSPNTMRTDYRGVFGIDPRTTRTPKHDSRITTKSTNWGAVASDIIPNFGDYTDTYVVHEKVYIAWADGRLGVPQPFVAIRRLARGPQGH